MYGYNAMNYTPLNIDSNRLSMLGFSSEEIQQLTYVYSNGGKFTSQALQQYGYSYGQAKKLMYMYNICSGRTCVETKDELARHFRKMFGSTYRISMQDLAVSKITEVPRVAVVANIQDEPYTIWNSNQYNGKGALYKVVDVSGQKVTVETPRKPMLKYKQAKKIDGVLEIKGVRQNGNVVVTFDKKYCKLCNRFIIVASLRNPEFHFGKYEILCFEGTRVYVYATNLGTKDSVRYNGGTQRVYDYGLFPGDIQGKLESVAQQTYQRLKGVTVQYDGPNSDYRVLTPDKQLGDEDVNEGVEE